MLIMRKYAVNFLYVINAGNAQKRIPVKTDLDMSDRNQSFIEETPLGNNLFLQEAISKPKQKAGDECATVANRAIKKMKYWRAVVLLALGFMITGSLFVNLYFHHTENHAATVKAWNGIKDDVRKLELVTDIFDAMNHLKIILDFALVSDAKEQERLFAEAAKMREIIILSRNELLAMALSKHERRILEEHGEYSDKGLFSQKLYQQLLQNFKDSDEALSVLLNDVNQYQKTIQDLLSQLQHKMGDHLQSQVQGYEEETMGLRNEINRQFGIVLLLSVLVAFTVLFLTWRQSRMIMKQHESLGNQNQRLEKKVEERTQHLLRMMEKAKDASRAKSEFLAVMSHEIRTPLNGILGTLHLMKGTELNADQDRYIKTSLHSSELLLSIINDILDYSKIESGKFTLNCHALDLQELLDNVAEIYRSLAEAKGLGFKLDTRALKHRYVDADKARILQILNNYLNNAIKFTHQGFIELKASNLDTDELLFEVKDSGIGINCDNLDSLFKEFSQIENGSKRNYGGSGLGLAICKQLALKMGGNVDAVSAYGVGSTFRACLDLKIISAQDYEKYLPEKSVVQLSNSPSASAQATIMLVEDNEINQMVAQELIEQKGYKVLVANNGLEAIDCIRHETVDLILMDCHMPTMDGYEATQRLREMGIDLPIIALTANAQLCDQERCFEVGMDGYLSKPFEPKNLMSTLEKFLNQRVAA